MSDWDRFASTPRGQEAFANLEAVMNEILNPDAKLSADLAAAQARVAELEVAHQRAVVLHTEEERLRWEAVTRAETAEARVAELDAAFDRIVSALCLGEAHTSSEHDGVCPPRGQVHCLHPPEATAWDEHLTEYYPSEDWPGWDDGTAETNCRRCWRMWANADAEAQESEQA